WSRINEKEEEIKTEQAGAGTLATRDGARTKITRQAWPSAARLLDEQRARGKFDEVIKVPSNVRFRHAIRAIELICGLQKRRSITRMTTSDERLVSDHSPRDAASDESFRTH